MAKEVEELKIVYTYDELSNEAKYRVVEEELSNSLFQDYSSKKNLAEEYLMKLGTELLKETKFRHADVTGVYYDFSYSQGSGAVLEFEYTNNMQQDYPELSSTLIKMATEDRKYADSYSLTNAEIEEMIKLLSSRELDSIFDYAFTVKHIGNYTNFETDYTVYSYANQNIRYALEEVFEDWIYANIFNTDLIKDLEKEFSNRAYKWYNELTDINNYSNKNFEDKWYNEDGSFAGYTDDFEN